MADVSDKSLPPASELISDAREAALSAYAPYSSFFVGAIVLCASGKTYVGCNVENVAYPLGVCAEASAIAAARVAEGDAMKILQIVVYALHKKSKQMPCSPCGGCRQRIAEFGENIEVLFFGPELVQMRLPIKQLLPYSFTFDRNSPGLA